MRTSHSNNKLVVITGGDPAGIGPETILKSLLGSEFTKAFTPPFGHKSPFTPIVVGDYGVFLKVSKRLNQDISFVKPQEFSNINHGRINFIDLDNVSGKGFKFGIIDKSYGKASMEYLLCALKVLKKIKNSALVTAPINKESINRAGFKFPGHTEFLSDKTKSKAVTMMLVGGPLKVSLVTRHIGLSKVSQVLKKENIIKTTLDTNFVLKKFFKIKNPKIGIAALNPHGGEGGLFGKEDKLIIEPAVDYLKKKIKKVTGPHPADSLFYKAYGGKLDAVVCMYHDQGLIPLKMIAFEKGVNLTIGLPFVRTSPDHGTGFDIAGKGKASPSAMLEAIKLATKI